MELLFRPSRRIFFRLSFASDTMLDIHRKRDALRLSLRQKASLDLGLEV
jgi:hypothetical protein